MRKALAAVALALLLSATAQAWELQIWNEFARFTPDGQLIKQDWTGQPPEPLNTITRPNRSQALRSSQHHPQVECSMAAPGFAGLGPFGKLPASQTTLRRGRQGTLWPA